MYINIYIYISTILYENDFIIDFRNKMLMMKFLESTVFESTILQADITMDGSIINTAVLYGTGYNGVSWATGMTLNTN